MIPINLSWLLHDTTTAAQRHEMLKKLEALQSPHREAWAPLTEQIRFSLLAHSNEPPDPSHVDRPLRSDHGADARGVDAVLRTGFADR